MHKSRCTLIEELGFNHRRDSPESLRVWPFLAGISDEQKIRDKQVQSVVLRNKKLGENSARKSFSSYTVVPGHHAFTTRINVLGTPWQCKSLIESTCSRYHGRSASVRKEKWFVFWQLFAFFALVWFYCVHRICPILSELWQSNQIVQTFRW